ncbi:fructosamine kinase family protein [Nocardioides sp. Bht2]|uniref:fructosamine kinase family protein n=1 Tax=Nocardioides sp. Bht2 TaxID=3392297 RepID=UPI0039B4AD16
MTRNPTIARRAEELLGAAVAATSPVAGGDICTATRVRLADGRAVFVKSHVRPPQRFFASEADSLVWLAQAAPDLVPEPLAVDDDCLILPWIETSKPTVEAAASFGHALARLHAAAVSGFGRESDGFIGRLPMRNTPAPDWAEFFAEHRVRPYLKLAHDRGRLSAEQSAAIESVLPRLGSLVPVEPAAPLHGDLWNGNVLWSADGVVRLIDPAAYGGHRETDLAMLALFGLPHLQRVLDSYHEQYPLADGWEDRIGLHQLFPLLTHAAMFGGGYGARAATVAARFS